MEVASCSNAGLAQRVNALGTLQGQRLQYDKSAVTHWLQGKRPRGVVPSLIAEALSQKLGSPVTLAEIGLDDGPELDIGARSLVLRDLADTLDVASELGQADMERRSFLYLLPFSVAAAAGPQRDWLLHLLQSGRQGRDSKVGEAEVAGLHTMMESFTKGDLQLGGQHARMALVSYLTNDVVPLLRRQAQSDEISEELFAGAADLYMLLGWKTYDTGAYGLAQRYLLQGLQLAREGGDKGLSVGSVVLSSMSNLAVSAGDANEAVKLAEAAGHSAVKANSPGAMTRAHAMEARAHASLGDGRRSAASISRAEHAQEVEKDRDPAWMQFMDGAYLANQMAFSFRELDDRTNMERAANLSLSNSQGRQVGSNSVYIATAKLRGGDIDEACKHALRAAEIARKLKSKMVENLVTDFWVELQRTKDRHRVREFGRSLAGLMPDITFPTA